MRYISRPSADHETGTLDVYDVPGGHAAHDGARLDIAQPSQYLPRLPDFGVSGDRRLRRALDRKHVATPFHVPAVHEVDFWTGKQPGEDTLCLRTILDRYCVAYGAIVIIGAEELPAMSEPSRVQIRHIVTVASVGMNEDRADFRVRSRPRKRTVSDKGDPLTRPRIPQAAPQWRASSPVDHGVEDVAEVVEAGVADAVQVFGQESNDYELLR